jgi:signal transduction histidine kinase
LSLYNAITEAAYLSGNFEQVEPLFQEVCKKAENLLARLKVYDQAINLAKENDYLQEKALAKELAGKFYLAQNRIKIAKIYLQDARYCYLQWGAKAKVEDLENRYPQLLQLRSEITEKHKVNTTQSATTKLEVFDLETVLKASQTIASEILLDQLLAKLMTILIENAGAQTGYVILPTEKEWQIAAIGSINNEKVELISADSITTLPTSLINYVARTQENVVLNNAIQEGDFQSEPWIMQNQSKSILCTPLLNQGKLTGIVLLENNLTTNAFTPERIEIINFLSTQAAISINNARLLKQQKELNQSLRLEIDEREKVEQKLIKAETTLQSLVAGTAAVTGQDFFPALVSHIAQALHVTYALVTEAVNGELHALAFWAYGALQPPISYFPARTPCEFALQDGLFLCETLVQRMFPEDLDLVKMQADSYLGISLKNANGDPIGNLCILDLKPLSDIEGIKTILDVFAARATAELERKRANEALYQLNEELEARVIRRTAQLEAANKALESFSYSVSHDLRAPLRAIDGFARMMEEDYSEQLDTEGNRYLKVVRDNAKRMGELIDDLLNLSRMDRKGISKQPVLLNELIRQVLTDLIPENRQIEFEIADLPICEADLSLITQVWINLLSNAIKYTGYQPVAHIQVGYEIINGEGVYFLRDNGSGFDMQYANNLFGVFQRLHREQEFEGTGIGLAIVQRIIQRHGGRIWAEAAVNQGATFYFTLPK